MKNSIIPNKKEVILWSALDLMTKNGFEKTSVSQIVKHAGVAQGTFYLYFKSKSELVLGIAKIIVEDILNKANSIICDSKTSLKSFIEQITDLVYEMTLKHKSLIVFCYSGTAYYSALNEWDELYIPYYKWLYDKLIYFKEKGDVSADYDLNYLSKYIIGLLEHGAEQYYLYESIDSNLETSKKTMVSFINNALKIT